MMRCEFCEKDSRKDGYMSHVKAKHVKELGQLLLKDFATSNITPISQWARQASVQMVVHSEMYEDYEYWFGVKPAFLRHGEKGYSEYIKHEPHQVEHAKFLQEVFASISLLDLARIVKPLLFRVPDIVQLQKNHKDLQVVMTIKDQRIAELEALVAQYHKVATVQPTDLDELASQNEILTVRNLQYAEKLGQVRDEVERLKGVIEDERHAHEAHIGSIRQQSCEELRYWMERGDKQAEKQRKATDKDDAKEKQREAAKRMKKRELKRELKKKLKALESSESSSSSDSE